MILTAGEPARIGGVGAAGRAMPPGIATGGVITITLGGASPDRRRRPASATPAAMPNGIAALAPHNMPASSATSSSPNRAAM